MQVGLFTKSYHQSIVPAQINTQAYILVSENMVYGNKHDLIKQVVYSCTIDAGMQYVPQQHKLWHISK
jgi:hypothetical protein